MKPEHSSTLTTPDASVEGAAGFGAMAEMAGLVSRLLKDPESDSAVIPQLMRLTESVPAGAARGAVESSVAAMSQLRGWLQQLQARQRLHTRFTDISGRLSRIDGVQPLMVALADEARRLVDAPLARLDAAFSAASGAEGGSGQTLTAHSGEYISRLAQLEWDPRQGWFNLFASAAGLPVLQFSDAWAEVRAELQMEPMAQQMRAEGIHGLIVVPMTLDGRAFGSLMVADRMLRRWTQLDVEALQHLATVSTRAISRAARAEWAQQSLRTLADRLPPGLASGMAAGAAPGLPAAAPVDHSHADGQEAVAPLLKGLLHGIAQSALMAFVDEVLGPLRRADQSRGTGLCRTLLTYIEHGHNARAAAKVLNVHVNTLHNRLETITALMPGWSEPERALDLHLALRLAQQARGGI